MKKDLLALGKDIKTAITRPHRAKQLLADAHIGYELSLIDEAIRGLSRRLEVERVEVK